MPSESVSVLVSSFIKLASYSPLGTEPALQLPEDPSQGDNTLKLAFEATEAGNFTHALTLTEEAIAQGPSNNELQGRAYNLRGTFK